LVLFDAGDSDIIVASIPTQPRSSAFDVPVLDWQAAGLLAPSPAPSPACLHKLATLEKALVRRALGRLSESDWAAAARVIRQVFP
jgi:hypothetical protein